MIRLWWEQAEGHTLKTRFTRKNITVTALSASTLTFSTDPGAQANTSAKVCPGPVLERMLRFPQMSSCTMRALPADTVVLTLLHLGIKNIRLGPTLPAFLSPNILNYLAENFHIAPVTTPEEDLKMLLKR